MDITIMKRIYYSIIFVGLFVVTASAADFQPGTTPLVDGVAQSTQVVVANHAPLFSWQYSGSVSSFTVIVSTDAVFTGTGELWHLIGTTSTANTLNYITRVAYAGTALNAGTTYSWQVALYDGESNALSTVLSFTTIGGSAELGDASLALAIDGNNPFDPSRGQKTRFVFASHGRDRVLQVRVFTLSGALVRAWPELSALRDAWYTQEWDGTNAEGEMVARGMYLVNLKSSGESRGVTRRVAVIKR